jgi:hypothetical protein
MGRRCGRSTATARHWDPGVDAHLATRSFGQCSGCAKGANGLPRCSAAWRHPAVAGLCRRRPCLSWAIFAGLRGCESVCDDTQPCAAECVRCKIPSPSAQTVGTSSHPATTARLRRLDRAPEDGPASGSTRASACSCSTLGTYHFRRGTTMGTLVVCFFEQPQHAMTL